MPVSEHGQKIRERNQQLSVEEAVDPAREYALRLLDRRGYSRAQLTSKLRLRGYREEVCTEVLDRLESVGLIDDAEFAASIVRTQHSLRGLGRRSLARELSKRGISGDDADRALAQISDEDEFDAAVAVARKKAHATRSLDYQTRLRRIVSQLQRKGHSAARSYDIAQQVLSKDDDD